MQLYGAKMHSSFCWKMNKLKEKQISNNPLFFLQNAYLMGTTSRTYFPKKKNEFFSKQ